MAISPAPGSGLSAAELTNNLPAAVGSGSALPAPTPASVRGNRESERVGERPGSLESSPSGVTNAVDGRVGSTNGSGLSAASPTPEDLALRYSADALRSYLHLQEQLHSALLAIHESRAEASVEAQTNVHAMLGRLEALEHDLSAQRAEDARASRNTNRLILLAAGGMFLTGLVAMVLTAVIQARGMNRLAEIAMGIGAARGLPGLPGLAGVPVQAGLPAPSPAALANPERLLLGTGPEPGDSAAATAEPARLQSIIRQLETRIREVESAAKTIPEPKESVDGPGAVGAGGAGNGFSGANGGAGSAASPGGKAGNPGGATFRAVVLAKAQALMNLGQAQAALSAVEEALARDPNDAEMYLRKGMALERLKRFDQALAAYDRAIALDARCTQAYLSKGGVLNQQSRYQEALACYELALEHRGRSA